MKITKRSQFFAALHWRKALVTSILLLLLLVLGVWKPAFGVGQHSSPRESLGLPHRDSD